MKLSSREVFQLADRCLASAGLGRGASKTNAKSIWWTEIYRRCGLNVLHDLIKQPSTLDPGALSLEDRTSMFTIIDSGSQPSIVSSTAALDFSCSRAKREGIGITYTSLPSSDGSLPTIGHTAYNAANRGLVSIVLVDHPTESASFLAVPGRSQPVVGEADLEGPSTSYARLQAIGQRGLYEQRHSPLVQAFFQGNERGRQSTTDAETLERMLEGATKENAEGTGDGEAGFFTICVDPNHAGNSSEIERTTSRFMDEHAETLTTVYQPAEIRNRGKTLIERGVDIEKDVWEDLFEFSNGIFSPDSVGSETGAGPSLER